MKRIALLLFLLVTVAVSLTAQFSTDREVYATEGNGVVYKFVATVKSQDSIASKSFTLSEYDAESFATYPIAYGKKIVSADSATRVFARILGTYGDGEWFVVDTLAAYAGAAFDSIATYNTGTLDLNNKKCAAYKISLKGLTGNPDDAVWTFSAYGYRRDPDLNAR